MKIKAYLFEDMAVYDEPGNYTSKRTIRAIDQFNEFCAKHHVKPDDIVDLTKEYSQPFLAEDGSVEGGYDRVFLTLGRSWLP